ncbi:MAG: DNA-directed DNA polymerase II small subunit [Promethearchaeota archaeon]|nr:MAG: DNA-directed DNA polymerase II small subunit [Candidatus Lokiarchaeota archaeon]
MNESISEKNRIIIRKFLESGINISPKSLKFISNLNNSLDKVDEIIKESSFIPSFNGHLTINFLKKMSDKEIQKTLKRHSLNELTVPELDIVKKKIPPQEDKNLLNDNDGELKNTGKNSNQLLEDLDYISSSLSKSSPKNKNHTRLPLKKIEKKKKSIRALESTKSTLHFIPSAKNYEIDYEILMDPTGKLYTNGDYNDFYELMVDKYNQLKKLMKRRSDTLSATNIANILRNSQNQEIAVIGLVKEIRPTRNDNYFITLEDNTGEINGVLKRSAENQETIKILERTLMDQMLFVSGTYNPGEKRKKGIIFINNLTKIDIPRDHEPNKSTEPLTIALLSDTHIGSREFEKDLWNRFINFLNGEIGNKNIRDIAGRIKYIVINGDLIDGIGVYPSQEEDLVINDLYKQYEFASELLSEVPDYIKVFYSSGNHEPVRNALPRPAVPKKYADSLVGQGVKCIGNPAVIKTHGVNTLIFHGDSLIDLNQLLPGLDNQKPTETMKELLICRHLAPTYGKKTQIAPVNRDWLIIDQIPDIFHTGHIHINGMGIYRNVSLVNSGCFQSQTDFMKSFGIQPTPGIASLIELDTLKGKEINLNDRI